MGTPDLLGTYGTFSFYTSDPFAPAGQVGGGRIYTVEVADGAVRAALEGPPDPLLKEPRTLTTDFVAHIDPSHTYAKIVVGAEERLLRVGEWSDWVPVQFELAWGDIRAECRFYLKQLEPEFVLYVTPLNLDPLAPALPVSSPATYAADLAAATGRFYTQGMPEDTDSLKTGVLTPIRVPRSGANRRGRKRTSVPVTSSSMQPTGSCSITSATSIRCRT